MAHGSTTTPTLRLKRSAQSGQKVMTAAWQVVYSDSSVMAFFFGGAHIDLSPMQVGDVVEVQMLEQILSTSALVEVDTITFTDARPASRGIVALGSKPSVYGVAIQMRQTAGAMRTIDTEFFDAKRIGLA